MKKKPCDLLSGINGACMHVRRENQRLNKCNPLNCPKKLYKYYVGNKKTVSYIWKSIMDEDGFIDCPEFEAVVRGSHHKQEANRICKLLNVKGQA